MRVLGKVRANLALAFFCALAAPAGIGSAFAADDANAPTLPGTGITFAPNDPAYLYLGAGSWEVDRDHLRRAEFDASLRPDIHFWILKPHAGLLIAGDGDYMAYAGPLIDVELAQHVVVTASTAVGVWGGPGFNLGSRIEFHHGIELAWRFDNASRLGIGFYHVSNGDLTRQNSGSESLLVNYAVPVGSIAAKLSN